MRSSTASIISREYRDLEVLQTERPSTYLEEYSRPWTTRSKLRVALYNLLQQGERFDGECNHVLLSIPA